MEEKVELTRKYSYNKDKNGWVLFTTKGKKKIKLRLHIVKITKHICRLSGMSYTACRSELVNAYEFGGLELVLKHYQETILAIHKTKLEELKKQKDEIENKVID